MKPSYLGRSKSDLKKSMDYHLRCSLCKEPSSTECRDLFFATALSVRDRMTEKILKNEQKNAKAKKVYYLSLEFLIGRLLSNTLHNLGLFDTCRELLTDAGVDIDEVLDQENDPGLGNGGLGRLAACFLDSMATLDMAGFGYGIHYEYGLLNRKLIMAFSGKNRTTGLRNPIPGKSSAPMKNVSFPFTAE